MDLEQQLRAALAPCRPAPGLRAVVMARVSAALSARGVRRTPGRVILVGTILAVAAAMTLLATHMMGTSSAPSPVVSVAPSAPVAEPATAAVEAAPSVPVSVEPTVTAKVEPKPAAAAVNPFTLRVTTLQNEAKDPVTRAAIEKYHAALLDALRGVSGLNLVIVDAAAPATGSSSEYDITIRSTGSLAENKFRMELNVSAGGRFTYPLGPVTGELTPRCTGTLDCGGPEGLAAAVVGILRFNVFPADASRLRELRVRLLDTASTPQQRASALASLGALQADGTHDPDHAAQPGTKRATDDAAVVRAAIDLAATTTDQATRAQVWRAMRGVRDASLVQPLITALNQDPDSKVRIAALSTLAADFSDEAGVRTALETAARDTSPVIRVLAQRGLVGEVAWNQRVIGSLKDTSLSAAARTEALFYTMRYVTPAPALGVFLNDDATFRAFAELYTKTAESPQVGGGTLQSTVRNSLGTLDHPAITDLLLGNLTNSADSLIRRQSAGQLERHASEPRVRAALEKASAEDTDMAVRERATKALKAAAVPATQEPTLRPQL